MKKLILFIFITLLVSCGGGPQPTKVVRQTSHKQGEYIPSTKNEGKHLDKINDKISIKRQSDRVVLSGSTIYDKCHKAVFLVEGSHGQGSAFFINNKGFAVSNLHVFEDNANVKAKIGDYLYKIDKVLYDEGSNYDFVIFHVNLDFENIYIPLSTEKPRIGEKVYAIGSPLGLENTFSSGEVSQLNLYDDEKLIQISVPIDHGSSGGALINEFGQAIGITTAGIDRSNANLNFALSINVLAPYLKE